MCSASCGPAAHARDKTASHWRSAPCSTCSSVTAGTSSPALVVSPALTFFPGYNMQRVVEHSLIRWVNPASVAAAWVLGRSQVVATEAETHAVVGSTARSC